MQVPERSLGDDANGNVVRNVKVPSELLDRVVRGQVRAGNLLEEVRRFAPTPAKSDRSHPWWRVDGVDLFDVIERLSGGKPGEKLTAQGIVCLSAQEAVREAVRTRGKVVVQLLFGRQVFRVLPVDRADQAIAEKIVEEAMPTEMVEPTWDEELPTIHRFRELAERFYLKRLMTRHNWNITAAAREAGIARQSLSAALSRLQLKRPLSKAPEPVLKFAAD